MNDDGDQFDAKIRARFWSKVDRTAGPDKCWEWRACKYPAGYGQFSIRYVTKKAHRVSYEMAFGPAPVGALILQSCLNTSCVNPAHLRVGTDQDKSDRIRSRGNLARGEEHGISVLTDADVLAIRERYAAGDVLQRVLAVEYGVTQNTVSGIVRGLWWSHVGGPRTRMGSGGRKL